MRKDMAKVIVERPRTGGGVKAPKSERKKFQQTDWEDQPKGEKIRAKWDRDISEKHLNEHLGPLWRYLLSNVGRPWNKVHSEICQHLRRDSAVQDHVRDHVDGFVIQKVVVIDGKPCHGDGSSYGELIQYYRDQLYVDPRTGILRLAKRGKYVRLKRPKSYVRKDDRHVYKKIEDIWYLVEVEPYTPKIKTVKYGFMKMFFYRKVMVPIYDLIIGKVTEPSQSKSAYGAVVRAVKKRQANKKEIRQMRLNG